MNICLAPGLKLNCAFGAALDFFLSSHPMQGQPRNEKEKNDHDAQFDKEQQNQISELFLVNFEEVSRHGQARVPEQHRRSEKEQSQNETDDERGEEKVPE
jgi:hypothetical protein